MQMRCRLDVHGEQVGTGIRKVFEIPVRVLHHQVDVELGTLLRRERLECLDDEGAYRDARRESTVHHVDVQPVRAGLQRFARLLVEVSQIGGNDGRRENHGASERRSAGW